jgi:CRP-like cAMP-binding protein
MRYAAGRRAAIRSEDSETLASTRWRTALDATRRHESRTPEQTSLLLTALATHPSFADMEEGLLGEVVTALRTRTAGVGEVIVREGDPGDRCYLVGEGRLTAYKGGASHEPVAEYTAGDSFGELALLYDCPRQATVRAATACTLYTLSRLPFRILVREAMLRRRADLATRLAAVDGLRGLPPSKLKKLADAMESVSFQSGDVITHGLGATQAAADDALYVVLLGEVDSIPGEGTGDGVSGTVKSSVKLGEGAVFGESCLVRLAAPGGAARGRGSPAGHAPCVIAASSHVRCARLLAADCLAMLGGPVSHAVAARRISQAIRQHRDTGHAHHRPGTTDTDGKDVPRTPIQYAELDVRVLLGEGSFGSVRLVIHRPTGRAFALKRLHKGHLIASKQVKGTINEYRILRQLSGGPSASGPSASGPSAAHPFINAVLAAFNTPSHVLMLLDLAQGGERTQAR